MPLPLELTPRAFRDLKSLEKETARRILEDLTIIRTRPRPWPGPPKVKKLEGRRDLFRLRIGDYRVIFEPTGTGVLVLRIMDRKELERTLRNL